MIAWLFPDKCSLCGIVGRPAVCEACEREMVPAGPAKGGQDDLSFRAGVFLYEGRASQAVRRLKYARSTALAKFMATALAPRIEELAGPDDLVVPVPIHWRRRGERGFNQAELLCEGPHPRTVARDVLKRTRATPPQASLPVAARGENLLGAFAADTNRVAGRRVLLVDDVLTTGHTAQVCARVLTEAGAKEVGILAFAMVEHLDVSYS